MLILGSCPQARSHKVHQVLVLCEEGPGTRPVHDRDVNTAHKLPHRPSTLEHRLHHDAVVLVQNRLGTSDRFAMRDIENEASSTSICYPVSNLTKPDSGPELAS